MRLKGSRKFVGGLALAAGLALTGVVGVAAQQEQMRQIEERYRATFRAQRENRGQERAGFDPLAGGPFDESAVRAAAQARADAQVEREVAQARMMYEMYNVLTSEQKAQLQAAREQRRQEFRSRRGARQGQTQLQ